MKGTGSTWRSLSFPTGAEAAALPRKMPVLRELKVVSFLGMVNFRDSVTVLASRLL